MQADLHPASADGLAAGLAPKGQDTPDEIESTLAQFGGGDVIYKHIFGMMYTEGVRYMADACGAYWLIDVVASYQREKCICGDAMLRKFQCWTLRKPSQRGDQSAPDAIVECWRDEGDLAFAQSIEYTDFPLDGIKFYVETANRYLPACCKQAVPNVAFKS